VFFSAKAWRRHNNPLKSDEIGLILLVKSAYLHKGPAVRRNNEAGQIILNSTREYLANTCIFEKVAIWKTYQNL
jgi:hypothetical protein